MRRTFLLTCLTLLFPALGLADASKMVSGPTLTHGQDGKSWVVEFELSQASDVEVAIVDPATGAVVRHLAAGVLGANAPAPLAADSLKQRIAWDGLDDYREAVADAGKLIVRVRAGMRAKLEQIVGGSPYLYFLGGHGDHNPWGINGLELKSDGKVYVVGHSSPLGPVAIRQYDVDGNYLQTVFPPPAGKNVDAMKTWGIHEKDDGTYMLRFNSLVDPSVGRTIVDTDTGGMARLAPTPEADRLSLWGTGHGGANFQMLTINTDGTVPPQDEQMQGTLVKEPAIRTGTTSANGPIFVYPSPDGKFFYLSGVHGTVRDGRNWSNVKEGFWRDGQVWKVDYATRTAKPFFALDEKPAVEPPADDKAGKARPPLGGIRSYSALHGVAVDKDGHVFVANRRDNCVLVLDKDAKIVRRMPVEYPDAVAISTRTGALYVTTRFGCERSGAGQMGLVKFDNWQTDDKPSVTLANLAHTWYTAEHKHSWVVLAEKKDVTNVWVAWTELPVQIYADDGKELKLTRDFHALAAEQNCWGFDRLTVDRKTDTVYVSDDHSGYWKVGDWKQPKFIHLPVKATSVAIDPRGRFLYANPGGSVWNKGGGISRYYLDQEGNPPANVGETGSNNLTAKLWTEWCFTGNGDMGFAVAPNGNIAGMDQKGRLSFFHGTDAKVPWDGIELAAVGRNGVYGGAEFDLAGNLYVGCSDGTPSKTPSVFKGDPLASLPGHRQGCTKIVKYAPTGTLESGNLFPTRPEAPAKVYDVSYGAFDSNCVVRTPRFSVDPFARICYPTNIQPRVTLIDNAGNEILHFGTWGNCDSTGGLAEDLVPTTDIPLGMPNSVAATDDYIYVADMVNLRVLRVRKEFALTAASKGQ